MPTKAPQWTEYLSCPVCEKVFDEMQRCPISLGCGHTVCKVCLSGLHQMKCPFDQNAILRDIDELPVNLALLQLVGAAVPDGGGDGESGEPGDGFGYYSVKKRIEDLALYLKPATTSAASLLSRPMQRKLVALINCQLVEEEGRVRAMKAARSLGERTISELILQHQNSAQLSANLWAAVRSRGCQFLGPAMQEEVLRLILLALEDSSALSRKVLVLFVVQRLESQYPQASKTAIGHVVQLLYRASCFKVTKRDGESSLMQLKEEFCCYEALRREHDTQIVQVATEAGLRIAPEQWSSLLYGDIAHKSHMQSIIDKLQTPQSFSQSMTELMLALQRSSDPSNLTQLQPHLDLLNKIESGADVDVPDWEPLDAIIEAVQVVVQGLVEFTQHRGSISCKVEPQMSLQNGKYKTNMCRDLSQRGHCPRGANCTFAHSEEEMCRYRGRQRKLVGGRGIVEKVASNETLDVSDTCHSCASPGPPPIALPQAEMSADASAASTVRPGHSELMSGHGGPVPGHGGPLPGHNGPLPSHGGPLPLQHPRPMEGESGAVRSAINVGPPQPLSAVAPVAMIDPTMKKPTVSPMYSPNVYATAPTIYHNPPPPSYEEPHAAWVPPVPPVQWVTPYGIAVQHHPIDAGVIYEQSGAAGITCTSQASYAPSPTPQGYWMPNAPIHNLQTYVAPMPQMNTAQTFVTQSHPTHVPQPMTSHVDGVVTAQASPGILQPTSYYDHPIAYAAAPQVMVPARTLVPLAYVPAGGTVVPPNVLAMPCQPYTVMMPVTQTMDDVNCYRTTATITSSLKQLEELTERRSDLLERLHKCSGGSFVNSLPNIGGSHIQNDSKPLVSKPSEMQALARCVADSMAATYCTVSLAKHMELGRQQVDDIAVTTRMNQSDGVKDLHCTANAMICDCNKLTKTVASSAAVEAVPSTTAAMLSPSASAEEWPPLTTGGPDTATTPTAASTESDELMLASSQPSEASVSMDTQSAVSEVSHGDEFVPFAHTIISKYGPISRMAKINVSNSGPVAVTAAKISELKPVTAVTPLKRPYPTHSQGLSRSEHPTLTNGMYVEHVGEPYGVHSRDGNAGVAPQTIWPGSDSLNSQHARSMTSQQCDQIHNQVAQVTNQIYSLQACENERLMRELHSVEQKIQNVQRDIEALPPAPVDVAATAVLPPDVASLPTVHVGAPSGQMPYQSQPPYDAFQQRDHNVEE